MYARFGLFIAGEWRASVSGVTAPVFSPATEQALGECPVASVADTEAALAAAATGFKTWAATLAFERADALHRIADEMLRRTDEAARMISLETGKPIAQSGREWGLSVDQFRWYAEEARRIYGRIVESRVPGGRFEIHHEPVGIVAAFTAWNFPAALIARKVAPALAAGCATILRPSSQTPGVAMVMVDCCRAGNLPPGAVNLVVGPTGATYTPLMAEKSVRKVSLTGSTRVGQQMIRDAAATLKKVSMELGGNAPVIVYDDADLEACLNVAVPTKFAKVGPLVCWDQWYPEAARLTALAGAQVIFYPTAIGWQQAEKAEYGESQVSAWQTMQRSHAIANGLFVAAVNRVGSEGAIEFWGASFVADPYGNLIHRATHDREETPIVECDLGLIDVARTHWPFLRDRRVDAYGDLTKRYID